VRLSFEETPDVVLEMFGRVKTNDYIVGMTVKCGEGDRTRCQYDDTFDVAISEVHTAGLMVRNADVIGLKNPPFCAAFFAWDDIDEVHIY
jgi:hypothetical protein